MNMILEQYRKPYGPLLPWMAFAAILVVGLWIAQSMGYEGASQTLKQLESEESRVRQELLRHKEAKRARKDLAQVWAVLPQERDFAPLALGITEEAKRNRVTLPALSYKTESTPVANTSKGVLQGTMTGRYEDLRRFLYDIETAEELVYIEDLDLIPSANPQEPMLTFNVKIATYLRNEPARASAQ